jgi:hypothetical protein
VRRWALTAAGALAAVLGLSAAPPAQAAAPANGWVYYIGDDGGLWSYTRFADGTFSQAVQRGPDAVAYPGAPVAAVRDTAPAVFFVGRDGAVYENCPAAAQPVPVTQSGYAPPSASITAAEGSGWVSVVVSAVARKPLAAPAAAPAPTHPVEISNPCVVPHVQLNAGGSTTGYTGGDMASYADTFGTDATFYVGSTGALTAQWFGPSTGVPIVTHLTAAGTAVPGSGVAAGYDLDGSLALFYAGTDGRLYRAVPQWQGGLLGAPVPNPTGPADVPSGAHLVAATSGKQAAVGYAAADGTLTVATLGAGGAWSGTAKLGPAGTLAPGVPVAANPAADGDFDWHCGNEPHVIVHIHGPQPGPVWEPAGPANALVGTYVAAV